LKQEEFSMNHRYIVCVMFCVFLGSYASDSRKHTAARAFPYDERRVNESKKEAARCALSAISGVSPENEDAQYATHINSLTTRNEVSPLSNEVLRCILERSVVYSSTSAISLWKDFDALKPYLIEAKNRGLLAHSYGSMGQSFLHILIHNMPYSRNDSSRRKHYNSITYYIIKNYTPQSIINKREKVSLQATPAAAAIARYDGRGKIMHALLDRGGYIAYDKDFIKKNRETCLRMINNLEHILHTYMFFCQEYPCYLGNVLDDLRRIYTGDDQEQPQYDKKQASSSEDALYRNIYTPQTLEQQHEGLTEKEIQSLREGMQTQQPHSVFLEILGTIAQSETARLSLTDDDVIRIIGRFMSDSFFYNRHYLCGNKKDYIVKNILDEASRRHLFHRLIYESAASEDVPQRSFCRGSARSVIDFAYKYGGSRVLLSYDNDGCSLLMRLLTCAFPSDDTTCNKEEMYACVSRLLDIGCDTACKVTKLDKKELACIWDNITYLSQKTGNSTRINTIINKVRSYVEESYDRHAQEQDTSSYVHEDEDEVLTSSPTSCEDDPLGLYQEDSKEEGLYRHRKRKGAPDANVSSAASKQHKTSHQLIQYVVHQCLQHGQQDYLSHMDTIWTIARKPERDIVQKLEQSLISSDNNAQPAFPKKLLWFTYSSYIASASTCSGYSKSLVQYLVDVCRDHEWYIFLERYMSAILTLSEHSQSDIDEKLRQHVMYDKDAFVYSEEDGWIYVPTALLWHAHRYYRS